jgi:dephospho-CoA kinase
LHQGQQCLIFDVPLLVESGARWRRQLDRVLVIDCDEDTQCQRVMLRNGLNAVEVQRIIQQQATRAQRLACADLVIFNQGLSLSQLETQVTQVAADFGL